MDPLEGEKKHTILFVCIGSRGDVQPWVALGLGVASSTGQRVIIQAHEKFKDFVLSHPPLEFTEIGGPMEDLLVNTPEGRAMMDANIFNAFPRISAFFGPLIKTWFKDFQEAVAVHKPTFVLLTTFPSFICVPICEHHKIGCIVGHTIPAYPTAEFAPATIG
eukprot:TRINITY_DN3178_c0_g1_i1.p1 TRINITY_DN3178_c0_g1~~TRINITY_DN3178_c0_g1_i1.p1  ORF type:complete len:171 (-),score=22.24 TRINITY_DN3178_c0_g1_i1:234-719(-)